MKLRCVLLVAVIAMAAADSDYYQQASYPAETPSQYYGQKRQQQSGLAG